MRRIVINPVLTLAAVFCIASTGIGEQSSPPTDFEAVFIGDGLVWNGPPKSLGHPYKTAPGSVLIFRRSGELDFVSALLYRDNQGISVDLKSGYIIRKGVWKMLGDGKVQGKYRVIYTSVPKVGETLPGPEKTWECTLVGSRQVSTASHLSCENSKFTYASRLKGLETLEKTIEFHSRRLPK